MAQSSLRNNKRLFSVSGGDPSLPDRVTYLENNEYKILYFQTISATTGTITKPTNSTILLDQFYKGGDAIVETLVNGQPSGQSPLTAGGAVVSVSSFDTSGNFTLSGTPTSFDVALVYILKIKAEDYQNLTIANIMAMEDLNPITQTITNGDTTHAPSSDAVYDALELKTSVGGMYAAASGTDTYTATLSPAPTAYTTGMQVRIKIPNANTITNPTLNLNSLGAKTIKGTNGNALPIRFFYPNGDYLLVYDGTDFIVNAGMMDRRGADYYLKTGSTTFDLRYSTNATAFTPTTQAFGKDIMHAMPFICGQTMTFDRIGIEITAAGTAASVCRLLIYDVINGVPTNLILDAGTIAADSATYQEITINQTLQAGLYALVAWHNSTGTPSARAIPIAACNKVLGISSTIGSGATNTKWTNSYAYTTAPSTYPSPITTNPQTPLITLRRSA